MANSSRVSFLVLLLCWCGLVQAAEQIGKDYSFAYSAPDSTRNEEADEEGQIEGTYTYLDPSGVERTVRYYAGDFGFQAQGAGIVDVPQLIEETRARVLARGGPYEPSPEELASWATADRSYSLSYHAGDSARSEVSRPDGYVTGSYSYIDEEGNTRVVEYEAGAGIGFRVKGDYIHPKIATDSVPSEYDVPVLQPVARTRTEPIEPSDIQRTFNSDGSITYSYISRDHSRTETVYENGDVRGTYSYIGEDGQIKTVQYGGTSATGFVISGDEIPSSIGSLDLLSTTAISGGTRGSFGVGLRPGGTRVDTTRTETIGGLGLGGLGLAVRPGGSTVETTRTETVTGTGGDGRLGIVVRPGGGRVQTTETRRTDALGGAQGVGAIGIGGLGGTRVETTRTTETRPVGTPFLLASSVEPTRGQQIRTITEERRHIGLPGGAIRFTGGQGGQVTTTTTTRQIDADGRPIQVVFQQPTSGTSGARAVRTKTTRTFVTGPGGNVITTQSRAGGRGTTIRRSQIHREGPPVGFISFSTQDGKQHSLDLTQTRKN